MRSPGEKRQLEADVWEIRQRTRRKRGEFMQARKEAMGFNTGGGDQKLRSVMNDTADTAQVMVPPLLTWGLAVTAGFALNWLVPLPILPAPSIGAMVSFLALVLFIWAVVTITTAGSNVRTNLPTTTIVESGPFRFTRNPIYLAMFLGLVGLAIAFGNFWLLLMLAPFMVVIHYGVVAREEAYLERKFGDVYRGYRSRVRRWL
jgi:protein-S-isoprenylcysteine O-methyltransferase Ste14